MRFTSTIWDRFHSTWYICLLKCFFVCTSKWISGSKFCEYIFFASKKAYFNICFANTNLDNALTLSSFLWIFLYARSHYCLYSTLQVAFYCCVRYSLPSWYFQALLFYLKCDINCMFKHFSVVKKSAISICTPSAHKYIRVICTGYNTICLKCHFPMQMDWIANHHLTWKHHYSPYFLHIFHSQCFGFKRMDQQSAYFFIIIWVKTYYLPICIFLAFWGEKKEMNEIVIKPPSIYDWND